MENDIQYVFPENREPVKPVAWYAQKKYFYLLILVMIAAGTVAAYFIVNQPQDLGPIVVNHKPKPTPQAQPAAAATTKQQSPTPAPPAPAQNTAAPKTAAQPAKAGSGSTGSTAVKSSSPTPPVTNSNSTPPVVNNTPTPPPVIKDQPIVYKNSQLGFSLNFPSTWQGYIVTSETIPGTAGVFDFGFAQQKSIFMIVAYTRTMWDRSKHDDLTYYLGANNNYAFIYNPAMGGADPTMSARLAELKSILATFSSQ